MEEQPKKIQEYDNISTTNQVSNSNKSKLIWIIVLAIIFTVGIIVFYFVFTGNSEKIDEENEKQERDNSVKKCLEMEDFDCNLLFTGPNIEEKCEKLTKLRDECFYKIAMMNFRLDLCWKITDEDLREICEMELNNIPMDIPQNADRFYPE